MTDQRSAGDTPPEAGEIPLALALSGGGLRATLFELGILLYLALADELKNVHAVVSVSGGSILAAHLATRWEAAIESPKGFLGVASDLIKFVRQDIRNSAVISWIWHFPLILLPNWFGTTVFLERQYRKHFGDKTLADSPSGFPKLAFVATDVKRDHRVAVMREGILRFDFDGNPVDHQIPAGGVRLSLAVTASSCFPPFFMRLLLNYRKLRVRYDEFPGKLNLRDGGIAGNLGVEVLTDLLRHKHVVAGRLLVCDAECGLAAEPVDTPLAVIDAQGRALSASARGMLERFGDGALLLRLAKRVPDEYGLRFEAVTKLSSYRTDLDMPAWSECFGLMLHGAAVCGHAYAAKIEKPPTPEEVRQAIKQVLESAGSGQEKLEPDEKALKRCHLRSYWRPLLNLLLAFIVWSSVLSCASEGFAWFFPWWPIRPVPTAWRLIYPEPVIDRDFDGLLNAVAESGCANSISSITRGLRGSLSRVAITVGPNSSSSLLYVYKSLKPEGCDHEIHCEVTFRGQFANDLCNSGDHVIVVGRILDVKMTGSSNVYVIFGNCSAKLATE